MKVSFKYNEELKNYAKSVGGKWDPNEKVWEIPDDAYDDVRYKAMDLGVTLETPATGPAGQGRAAAGPRTPPKAVAPTATTTTTTAAPQQPHFTGTAGPRNQGTIWLGRSRDGRYMIMRINLVAFTEDVQAVLDGTKRGARFRVMAPRPQTPTQ